MSVLWYWVYCIVSGNLISLIFWHPKGRFEHVACIIADVIIFALIVQFMPAWWYSYFAPWVHP